MAVTAMMGRRSRLIRELDGGAAIYGTCSRARGALVSSVALDGILKASMKMNVIRMKKINVSTPVTTDV
jgi:hypothetical protein